MKIQCLLGAALCAAALGAAAQSQQEERVTIPAPRLTIDVPAHHYSMNPSEFADFRGGYTLSNGQTLYLKHNGIAMYAELDDQGPHRIVATGPSSFVALDRKLSVRIDLKPDGDVGGEVLIAMPVGVAANGEPEERVVRLAMGN